MKKTPPKSYFWSILFALNQNEYNKLISDNIIQLETKKKIKKDTVILTSEALDIFKKFKDDGNLNLMSKFKS